MTSTLSTVYHITVFSWYAFIVKSLADKDGEELPAGIFVYGGPWKYLTFLNLVSTLAVIAEIQFVMLVAGMTAEYWKSTLLVFLFQLLQMAFFGLAAVNDLQPDTKSDSTLIRCKDLLFSVFAFPVGTVRNFFFNLFILFIQEKKVNVHCALKFPLFAFDLSVCCPALLEYFCLRQRISLPSLYWHLLPPVD